MNRAPIHQPQHPRPPSVVSGSFQPSSTSAAAAIPPDLQPLFLRISFRRGSHSSSTGDPAAGEEENRSLCQPLVPPHSTVPPLPSTPGASSSTSTSCSMTAGEFGPGAPPLYVPGRGGRGGGRGGARGGGAGAAACRSGCYKALALVLLLAQGGLLDLYLIAVTDLYWCSWVATDLVVLAGWGIFFAKNSRGLKKKQQQREKEAAAESLELPQHSPSSQDTEAPGEEKAPGPSPGGEWAYTHLAWLIYSIAFTPKVALLVGTSLLEQVELRVPFGGGGLRVTVALSAPLLYALVRSLSTEEDAGACALHQRARACFLGTCLDLLDAFALMEQLLMPEAGPLSPQLRYTLLAVYFVALASPVLWLYDLNKLSSSSGRPRCGRSFLRLLGSGVLVDGPLLAIRGFLCFGPHQQAVSVFLLKNVFFLSCRGLEALEGCCCCCSCCRDRRSTRGRSRAPAHCVGHFTHCISENDMGPHGYVNTLAVTAQT
ncbi:transmembrane protein 121B [Ambystoma mexicanum]|uniref:transmembrane protein 121B n=1 Tax=Ambystoma mexicanum TaxID=8296 RepID=UPI0037E78C82